MAVVAFDTLKLADRLEAGGFTAVQARTAAGAFADAMSGSDLATKADLAEAKAELKSDVAVVKADLAEVKAELKSDVAAVRADLAEVKAELKSDVAVVKADLAEAKAELKSDVAAVRADLAEVKAELKSDVAAVRAELKGDIAAVKAELKGDIAAVKAELKSDIASVKMDIVRLDERIERRAAESDAKTQGVKNELIRWLLGIGGAAMITIIGTGWTIIRYLPHP
jgi:chromosome segregation ATPase